MIAAIITLLELLALFALLGITSFLTSKILENLLKLKGGKKC